MNKTITIERSHPLLKFFTEITKANMTSLQQEEFFQKNLQNQNIEITGNLNDVRKDEFDITVKIPYQFFGEYSDIQGINVKFQFEEKFKQQLLNFNRFDLLTCEGVLNKLPRINDIVFKLNNVSIYTGTTDEEKKVAYDKENQKKWAIRGWLSLLLTIFFVSLGGWWWIGAIIAGISTLICFNID